MSCVTNTKRESSPSSKNYTEKTVSASKQHCFMCLNRLYLFKTVKISKPVKILPRQDIAVEYVGDDEEVQAIWKYKV